MVSDDIKTAAVQVDGGHQVNKTRKIQDRDKTGIRQRQVNGGLGEGKRWRGSREVEGGGKGMVRDR